jgi:hypothetical protein
MNLVQTQAPSQHIAKMMEDDSSITAAGGPANYPEPMKFAAEEKPEAFGMARVLEN